MLEQLILPDLRQAFQEQDWESIAEISAMIHPSLVVEVLDEQENLEQHWEAFRHIPAEVRVGIFEYLDEEDQDEIVERLPRDELAQLLELMSHDDRVDLVKRMDDERQSRVMPLVARADREDILRLSRYPEQTAGSIMTTDYAALLAQDTVAEALGKLRKEAPDRETIYYVYVVDADRHLIGFVSLKDLILASPTKTVGQVMREDVMYVMTDMDVELVADRLAQYDLIALPVVDQEIRLVGIITHDDVIDVVIEEATEDAHLMGAVQPLENSYFESSIGVMIRKRVIWLYLLFCAEMLTSFVLRNYEELFATFVILVIFMPVITATGGNSGSQTASLITRALAIGEVDMKDWLRVGLRELFAGISLGLLVGVFGALVVSIFFQETAGLGLTLVLALVSVTTCGSLVGALMPLFFKRVGLDPAISSGPFVASMVDVVGIFIYCTIAASILPFWH
ncbi:Magnesium transporter MgtE [Planctomycetes bacterium Pan216]|uniref:Magnesium transporter MgtE n=1 Tax=Kolteria novifilia TaxID=2527975 RepID=A0A518B052_9BACT|nr:Magnesium transporter MgtE [Planctomycetes bacterium Pan216]